MTKPEFAVAYKKAQQDLIDLTRNQYFGQIPTLRIEQILTDVGFAPEPWSPKPSGDTGRATTKISSSPQNAWAALTWYRMGSGRYEIVAYLTTDQEMTLPEMSPKDAKRAVDKVNRLFDSEINKKYHLRVPIGEVTDILETHGFDTNDVLRVSLAPDTGRIHEPIGSKKYLAMSWYRMESGRYEITAYVS